MPLRVHVKFLALLLACCALSRGGIAAIAVRSSRCDSAVSPLVSSAKKSSWAPRLRTHQRTAPEDSTRGSTRGSIGGQHQRGHQREHQRDLGNSLRTGAQRPERTRELIIGALAVAVSIEPLPRQSFPESFRLVKRDSSVVVGVHGLVESLHRLAPPALPRLCKRRGLRPGLTRRRRSCSTFSAATTITATRSVAGACLRRRGSARRLEVWEHDYESECHAG